MFFDRKDVVRSEFVPQGQTVSKGFYRKVFRRLRNWVRHVRKEMCNNCAFSIIRWTVGHGALSPSIVGVGDSSVYVKLHLPSLFILLRSRKERCCPVFKYSCLWEGSYPLQLVRLSCRIYPSKWNKIRSYIGKSVLYIDKPLSTPMNLLQFFQRPLTMKASLFLSLALLSLVSSSIILVLRFLTVSLSYIGQ